MSPRTTSSQRRTSSSNRSPWPRFSEQRFLEDVDYDDCSIGEMLFNAYREQVYHSQREGLSVGQSSSSVSDRTGQPVVETCQELNPEHAQIWTLLNRQREQILAADWPKKYTKIEWNDRVAERTSLRSSRRTTSARSSTSSWTVIAAKFGITWSSWEKSQRNGRIEEVSEFHLWHYCKTKISRRSGYYLGTYLQDTGIAKLD